MRFYMLQRSDGTQIRSGVPGEDAICSLKLTRSVADGQELAFGACCAAMLEAELFYYGQPPICQGEQLTLFGIDGQALTPLGVFYAEAPSLNGPHRMTVTAYDGVSRLDQDLSQWLASLTGWPYRASQLARLVCGQCGLTLLDTQVVNGDFPIEAFTAQVTGRRLMQWLGQILGRFLVADERGNLAWDWYRENPHVRVGPQALTGYMPLATAYSDGCLELLQGKGSLENGALTLSSLCAVESGRSLCLYAGAWRQHYYLADSLTAAAYGAAPVAQVRIRQSREDVGVCWPADGVGSTYVIEGNPMLTASDREGVCKALFEVLEGFGYTPCSAAVPEGLDIRAGDILTVTDAGGRSFVTPVMKYREENGCVYIESTGSASRDPATGANRYSYAALSGKVMNLQMDVEGLHLENAENEENLARLSLTVDGLETRVQAQEATGAQVTQLTQKSDALELQVQSIWQEGVSRVQTQTGYTFDREGLRITKSGQVMENVLDNTGMYVRRGEQTILQANDAGVTAVDVRVSNYLILGSHCRLEDYATQDDPYRTACFYL